VGWCRSQSGGARVIATAHPGEATLLVERLGADQVVDHTGDLEAELEHIRRDGITAIAHAAGDPRTLAAVLRPGGRMVSAVGATAEQVGRSDIEVTPIM